MKALCYGRLDAGLAGAVLYWITNAKPASWVRRHALCFSSASSAFPSFPLGVLHPSAAARNISFLSFPSATRPIVRPAVQSCNFHLGSAIVVVPSLRGAPTVPSGSLHFGAISVGFPCSWFFPRSRCSSNGLQARPKSKRLRFKDFIPKRGAKRSASGTLVFLGVVPRSCPPSTTWAFELANTVGGRPGGDGRPQKDGASSSGLLPQRIARGASSTTRLPILGILVVLPHQQIKEGNRGFRWDHPTRRLRRTVYGRPRTMLVNHGRRVSFVIRCPVGRGLDDPARNRVSRWPS